MYSFDWDAKTGGYALNTKSARSVAHEIRPVFAEELRLVGFDRHFRFDFAEDEQHPVCWARQNVYLYRGEEVARLEKTQYGKPLSPVFLAKEGLKLRPVDVDAMLAKEASRALMDALVADTLKRLKEMFDQYARAGAAPYVGFSGGKDSVLLLDLCHRALPLSVPVVFSDTDMELPDTYAMWQAIQARYPGRPFLRAKSKTNALDNWRLFGPPSQTLRWCCSVHKAAPAVLLLKRLAGDPAARTEAFVGVRGEESIRRSKYDDVGVGEKNGNQVNAMPILKWSAHELWFYTFAENLPVNRAYRLGLPRVGCLLCPMSTDRQAAMISNTYPKAVRPFEKALVESLSRDFPDKADAREFVASGGWHARHNGFYLKNPIAFPGMQKDGDSVVFSVDGLAVSRLREWIKTLGKAEWTDDCHASLTTTAGDLFLVSLDDATTAKEIRFAAQDGGRVPPKWDKLFRFILQKCLACAGCGECEAECPAGAISFSPEISVNSSKCIHCLNCFDLGDGCLRFHSLRQAGGSTMSYTGISNYNTFGLDPSWIPVLLEERENFRATQAIGGPKVKSAAVWFREAGLIEDATSFALTPLAQFAERVGAESPRLWDLLWMRLVNNSPLVKWYIRTTSLGEWTKAGDLNALMEPVVASVSSRKSALSSLSALIKNSPLGTGESALIAVERKGTKVAALMRKAREPEPLALLFGLFAMAEAAGRNVFSVTAMMTADATAPFVSPLAAFGMGPDAFKRMATGLSYNHPDFLTVRFAQGLDEVEVKRDGKTAQDVVKLMLGK